MILFLSVPPLHVFAAAVSPTCPTAVTCSGDQTFNAGFNRCDDPDCTAYFFQELDSSSHTCGLVSDVALFACLVVLQAD